MAIVAPVDGIVRTHLPPPGSALPPQLENDDNNGNSSTRPAAPMIVVGYMEACPHPTIVDGLCAVCGATVTIHTTNTAPTTDASSSSTSQNGTPSTSTMSRMTVGGLNVTVSHAESVRMAHHEAQRLHKLRKLSLVLDLDHTLVHATADPRAYALLLQRNSSSSSSSATTTSTSTTPHCKNDNNNANNTMIRNATVAKLAAKNTTDLRSLVLPVLMVDPNRPSPPPPPPPHQQVWFPQRHCVKLRPHIVSFLSRAMDQFELGVYTAGTREYAEHIALLIARHMVGAPYDQLALDHLRHYVTQMEAEFHKQQQQQNRKTNDSTAADEIGGSAMQEQVGSAYIVNGVKHNSEEKVDPNDMVKNQSLDNGTGASGKKRKRVTFGFATASDDDRIVSQEHMNNLLAELKEAERLEAKALEMRQRLFGSRVVSRTEVGDLGRDVKSLKRIFPCGGSMAAVIDDREDVWANAEDISSVRRGEPPDNLLLVRPYHWNPFLGFADVNNSSGTDYLRQSGDIEHETDEQLEWTANVLKRLHEIYFSHDEPDRPTVPTILSNLRREVLSECVVVFSGLVPLDTQQQKSSTDSKMPRPLFVRYAENLGATVITSINESVTHVVANKDGTEKILAARRIKGCRIVKASWLIECAWSLTRRDESKHLLETPRVQPHSVSHKHVATLQPNGGGCTELRPATANSTIPDYSLNTSADTDDDEEDDDFIADLENELMTDTNGVK